MKPWIEKKKKKGKTDKIENNNNKIQFSPWLNHFLLFSFNLFQEKDRIQRGIFAILHTFLSKMIMQSKILISLNLVL